MIQHIVGSLRTPTKSSGRLYEKEGVSMTKKYDDMTTEEKIEFQSKKYPNAKNLKPNKKGSDEAKHFNQKSLETRRENKLKREAMAFAVKEFGSNKLDPTEDLTSLDTLRILRNLYISQEDFDKVLEISKVLAEYEEPKKSRVEEIKSEIDFNEYKEEDVEAYLDNIISLDELRKRKTG